jgi:hypothetical protein
MVFIKYSFHSRSIINDRIYKITVIIDKDLRKLVILNYVLEYFDYDTMFSREVNITCSHENYKLFTAAAEFRLFEKILKEQSENLNDANSAKSDIFTVSKDYIKDHDLKNSISFEIQKIYVNKDTLQSNKKTILEFTRTFDSDIEKDLETFKNKTINFINLYKNEEIRTRVNRISDDFIKKWSDRDIVNFIEMKKDLLLYNETLNGLIGTNDIKSVYPKSFDFVGHCYNEHVNKHMEKLLKHDLLKAIHDNDIEKVADIIADDPEIVNKKFTSNGITPLMMSHMGPSEKITKLLLKSGADDEVVDHHGHDVKIYKMHYQQK